MMSVRVQKYGGSSVATIPQINAIADRVATLVRSGEKIIVVVSAMGDTTDDLASLALQITDSPHRRELDMLLSTGERITMSLLAIAINARECTAISFTGSQAGILTDSSHTNARITDLKPTRVQSELEKGSVVVLAGFQGVNPITKEITTLGRGGSDSTAVAMAAHFKAAACDIMKDVDGVYSADPRIVPNAIHIQRISYDHLLEMTFWGSQVLHYRSVEMAKQHQVPIVIQRSDGQSNLSTHISNHDVPSGTDQPRSSGRAHPLSINSHSEVLRVQASFEVLKKLIQESELPLPEFLAGTEDIFLTAPAELLTSLKGLLKNATPLSSGSTILSETMYSAIGVTYFDPTTALDALEIESVLKGSGILSALCIARGCSVGAMVPQNQRVQAIQLLHQKCFATAT